ncbi:O-antigen ligase family protein [Vibrio tasmaniensis]|nr:O-antigen ligase family protein [Vibrio tasmaniensis]
MIKFKHLQKNENYFSLLILLSIFGYFMFKTSYRYVGDFFQTIIYLGTLFALYSQRVNILKLRVVQLFIASIIIQIISWYNLHKLDPEYINELSLTWLGYLFIFIAIAYWLKGDNNKINITLVSFSIGAVLTCLLHSKDIHSDYSKIINGVRVNYDFMNANHSAALLATSLIIVTYIVSKIKISIGKLAPLLILTTITIFLLMGTQSRSAYVALTIPLSILFYSSLKNSKENLAFTFIIILGVLFSFIYSSLPRVSSEAKVFQEEYELSIEKTTRENENLIEIKSQPKEVIAIPSSIKNITIREKMVQTLDDFSDNIPYTSVGIRVHFWNDTIKQFLFNPVLGLGNNANTYILEHSNHSEMYEKYKIRHLHSSYLELIASYGLIGVGLIFYLYFHIFNIVKKKGNQEMLIFAACLYSFLIVLNFFESYLFVKSGVLIHTLVLGVLYSYNFKGDIRNETK